MACQVVVAIPGRGLTPPPSCAALGAPLDTLDTTRPPDSSGSPPPPWESPPLLRRSSSGSGSWRDRRPSEISIPRHPQPGPPPPPRPPVAPPGQRPSTAPTARRPSGASVSGESRPQSTMDCITAAFCAELGFTSPRPTPDAACPARLEHPGGVASSPWPPSAPPVSIPHSSAPRPQHLRRAGEALVPTYAMLSLSTEFTPSPSGSAEEPAPEPPAPSTAAICYHWLRRSQRPSAPLRRRLPRRKRRAREQPPPQQPAWGLVASAGQNTPKAHRGHKGTVWVSWRARECFLSARREAVAAWLTRRGAAASRIERDVIASLRVGDASPCGSSPASRSPSASPPRSRAPDPPAAVPAATPPRRASGPTPPGGSDGREGELRPWLTAPPVRSVPLEDALAPAIQRLLSGANRPALYLPGGAEGLVKRLGRAEGDFQIPRAAEEAGALARRLYAAAPPRGGPGAPARPRARQPECDLAVGPSPPSAATAWALGKKLERRVQSTGAQQLRQQQQLAQRLLRP
eukprot:TRINITY_DN11983_c0_g1_i2.p1 TRINITY_DN11983_c0_g1~~TRINITY_DN11983_c0_g1_i2.p1  ORF type:complete len:544 (+),score=119.69 TRINITY_DN11983_c0_g1_i2:82-1632(+)